MGIFNPAFATFKIWTFWGDGSDGDVVIAVDTHLTRDMQYRSLTINFGKTLFTDGFIIQVSQTLTNIGYINSGAIGQSGAPWGSLPGGLDGGAGNAGFGDPGLGDMLHGIGGDSGKGGNGSHGAGGLAGTMAIDETLADRVFLAFLSYRKEFGFSLPMNFGVWSGAGGAGGTGDGGANSGANGGGGGGMIVVIARLIISPAGQFLALGGVGSDSVGGNTGGGGGGGGGTIIAISNSLQQGTWNTNGGGSGNGHGTGTNGDDGKPGTIQYNHVY